MQTHSHQLLGAEVSYYTAKVRAYLRYKAIPFAEVPATREVYRDVIVPRTGVRFIPVLITDDDVAVQDSADIIVLLEKRYPNAPVVPQTPLQKLTALLFQVYGDEWLLLPAMHYRWNWPENRSFAIEEFGRLSAPSATPEEQRAIGDKLSGPFAGALPALGVEPRTVDAIEASYSQFLVELDRHFAQAAFLLGTRPSLGDFSLFGPLYAHLYRDPASGRLMRKLAPRVVDWIERMQSPAPLSGEFVADDSVPPTLEPLLTRMFSEFGPVLARTIERLTTVTLEPRSPIPRAIGSHEFRLGDVTGTRAIFPFNVWRWQQAHDEYQALRGEARDKARALFERVGGLSLLEIPLSRRLVRRDNRLWFAEA